MLAFMKIPEKQKKIRAFLKTKQDKKNIFGQVDEKGLFAL